VVRSARAALARAPEGPAAHLLLARGLAALDRPAEAGAALDGAIAAAPDDWRCYAERASHYRRQRANDLALKDANRAIELAPQVSQGYVLRGQILLLRKQLQPALEDCDRALALTAEEPMALLLRARVRGALGDLDLALADRRPRCRAGGLGPARPPPS